jgi:hypothetical protein
MNENNQPAYMPPIRAYSKTDLCYILRNPQVNLAAPGADRAYKRETLKKKIIDAQLLPSLGITEDEYNRIKIFTTSQSELIIRTLL